MNLSVFLPVLYMVAAVVVALVVRSLASGITSVPSSSWAGIICGGVVAVIGLVNSILTGIKTSQEIRLNKRKISEQDRRIIEPPPMTTAYKWGDPMTPGVKPHIINESEERGRRT